MSTSAPRTVEPPTGTGTAATAAVPPALVGVGATGAAAAGGAAAVGTGVQGSQALADASAKVIAGLLRAAQGRGDVFMYVRRAVAEVYPDATADELDRLASAERDYEAEFLRKMRQRLERDVPQALALGDGPAREEALNGIVEREQRFTRMRDDAMVGRALGARELMDVAKASPAGAYWKLSERGNHCPECLALGERFWPISVLTEVHPPMHPNCGCTLLSLGEAVRMGLMTASMVPAAGDAPVLLDVARRLLRDARDAEDDGLEEAHVAWWLQEARGPARFAKGFEKGGEFRPQRGGDPGRRIIRSLERLAPHGVESPSARAAARRGKWTSIRGRQVRVPEATSWSRRIDGVRYHSPAGTTTLVRNGERMPDDHPDLAPLPAGAPPAPPLVKATKPTPATLDRSAEDRRSMLTRAARASAITGDAGQPPVSVGAGPEALSALRDAGFRQVGTQPAGIGKRRLEFVHSGHRLEVDVDSGRVSDVRWAPRPPEAEGRELSDGPPDSFPAFVSDAKGYADQVGRESHSAVLLPSLDTDIALEDHAGNHGFDGRATVGRDVARDIEAAAAARAAGRDLSDSEARGVWAAYWATMHEAVGHGVNPIPARLYADDADANLEEALAEEMAHLHAVKRLRAQGQHDVLEWRRRNPDALPVRGVYLSERGALAALLDDAGITDRKEREGFVTDLAQRVPPAERMDRLAAALEANGFPGDAMTQVEMTLGQGDRERGALDAPRPAAPDPPAAPPPPNGGMRLFTREPGADAWDSGPPVGTWNQAADGLLAAHATGQEVRIVSGSTGRGRLSARQQEHLIRIAAGKASPGTGHVLDSEGNIIETGMDVGLKHPDGGLAWQGNVGTVDNSDPTWPVVEVYRENADLDEPPELLRPGALIVFPHDQRKPSPGTTKATPGFFKDLFGKDTFEPPPAKDVAKSKKPPEVIGGQVPAAQQGPIPNYDHERLELGKSAGGSNGARWAFDGEGNRWLLKTYRGNEDRVATEVLANAVYRAMGAKVADAGTIGLEGPPDFAQVPDQDIGEPPLPEPKTLPEFTDAKGKKFPAKTGRVSAGVIVAEPDGRMWLMEPKGKFGGYQHTFPKGGVTGDTGQQTALRELWEETGLHAHITSVLGDYEGDTGVTRYYLAVRTGGEPKPGKPGETEAVKLVTPDEAAGMLNRERDKKVLADAVAAGLPTGEYPDVFPPASDLRALTYPALEGEVRPMVFKKGKPSEAVGEHYVTDALLGNWDVAGLEDDNIMWDPDGKPFRVDQGGTFEFRAQGQSKPFGPVPTELWTMIQKGQGKRSSKVSESQMREQAAAIERTLTPEKVDELVNAAPFRDEQMRERLRENLKARVDWLGGFARGEHGFPQPAAGDEARDVLNGSAVEVYPEEAPVFQAYPDEAADINAALQAHMPPDRTPADIRHAITTLDGVLKAAKTSEDVYLHIPLTQKAGNQLDQAVGKAWTEPGYMALQLDAQPPDAGPTLRVTVPGGSHALYVPAALGPDTPEGFDVIVRRGARLRITGKHVDPDGRMVYEAVLAA